VTGGGDQRPLKVDLHTHILPEHLPDLTERYGTPGFIQLDHHAPGCARMILDGALFREIEDNCWDPRRRLEDCAATGVDVQVLSTVPVMFNYAAKPEHTLDLSTLLNDHVASVCARFPNRFVGLGTLPMQKTDLAIYELERCIKDLKLAGAQIGTHINGWSLDHPDLFPVFEAAADLGAAIFVHPWDILGKDRMTKYWLPWLVGMPAETALAICSVIFGGVLERLPALRIAFAHGGGSFPARSVASSTASSRAPTCARSTTRSAASVSRPLLRRLARPRRRRAPLPRALIGAERIAHGIGLPVPARGGDPRALIESMDDLDAATTARLLGGTALEFLASTARGSRMIPSSRRARGSRSGSTSATRSGDSASASRSRPGGRRAGHLLQRELARAHAEGGRERSIERARGLVAPRRGRALPREDALVLVPRGLPRQRRAPGGSGPGRGRDDERPHRQPPSHDGDVPPPRGGAPEDPDRGRRFPVGRLRRRIAREGARARSRRRDRPRRPARRRDAPRTEDIVAAIEREAGSLALVLLPGVQYYTGQLLDIPGITAAAHAAVLLRGGTSRTRRGTCRSRSTTGTSISRCGAPTST
jgi:aminocarboxymuconate-semialdehyde decarboxylase